MGRRRGSGGARGPLAALVAWAGLLAGPLAAPLAGSLVALGTLGALGTIAAVPAPAAAQQVADTVYTPDVADPAYPEGDGPVVAIDAAHHNFHTAEGRYRAFAELLRADGYRVRSSDAPFTAGALAGVDVLVISNALHEESARGWAPLPSRSAFTPEEIAYLDGWVSGGGSLLLIADHMPIAGHAEALAAAFGLRFQNGFAIGEDRTGVITFRRSDGTLRPGPVTDGSVGARIDSVTTFMGQAFRADPDIGAEPVLVLPERSEVLLPRVAWELSDSTPRVPGAYLLQGALVEHGRGRVAAFGEAAMFTAQWQGTPPQPMGMNHPAAAQNARLVRNVLRWLAR